MDRAAFVATVAPIAVKLRLEGSSIFASVRVAQTLLETGGRLNGWNNIVGYKVGGGQPNGYWKGASVNVRTWEVINDQTVYIYDSFRAYDTIEDCLRDQDLLFLYPRYDRVRQAGTPELQAEMLRACGYATDPNYAGAIIDLIRQNDFKRFDREVEQVLEKLEQLQLQISALQSQVAALEGRASMPIPEWAEAAVQKAVAAGIIDSPENGSYDFYRLLTILHRKQLI
ncbi:glycoside hydrolase family 73 protein [Paenibacillus koleovorans]|uniref:glycoside hydrolase family 73 protein n=1 Tax=Paenibacillus koleovorans TaxID=121608 RepID=UPI000FD87632|nr:glucosaminidase domain-containing protein [Paenibacillus koleovorans]